MAKEVAGQVERRCRYAVEGYSQSTRRTDSTYRHIVSGGFRQDCSDGASVRADSAVIIEYLNQVALFGRVSLRDSALSLKSEVGTYYGRGGNFDATGDVVLTFIESGATVAGPDLNYRPGSEFRPLDQALFRAGCEAQVFPSPAEEEALEPIPASDSLPGAERQAALESQGEGGHVEGEGIRTDSVSAQGQSLAVDSAGARADSLATEAAGEPPGSEEGASGSEEAFGEEDQGGKGGEDATIEELVPARIEAARCAILGRRHFSASGAVTVTRDSLVTTGDSLYMDQSTGAMAVIGDVLTEGAGFSIRAETVDALPAREGVERFLARGDAVLLGSSIIMQAPAIRIGHRSGAVQRVVGLGLAPVLVRDTSISEELLSMMSPTARMGARRAVEDAREAALAVDTDAPPRASVSSASFHLAADSIEAILSDDGVVEAVRAAGRARAEAMATDAARSEELPELLQSDWIVGDTIITWLLPGAAGAIGGRAGIESITAIGNAKTLYRITMKDTLGAAADSSSDLSRPPLHYVAARRIRMLFEGGEVTGMEVAGKAEGFHLEPRALLDSTAIDTTSVTDTLARATGAPEGDEGEGRTARRPNLESSTGKLLLARRAASRSRRQWPPLPDRRR